MGIVKLRAKTIEWRLNNCLTVIILHGRQFTPGIDGVWVFGVGMVAMRDSFILWKQLYATLWQIWLVRGMNSRYNYYPSSSGQQIKEVFRWQTKRMNIYHMYYLFTFLWKIFTQNYNIGYEAALTGDNSSCILSSSNFVFAKFFVQGWCKASSRNYETDGVHTCPCFVNISWNNIR